MADEFSRWTFNPYRGRSDDWRWGYGGNYDPKRKRPPAPETDEQQRARWKRELAEDAARLEREATERAEKRKPLTDAPRLPVEEGVAYQAFGTKTASVEILRSRKRRPLK
jgi:hypothetical protein